MRKAIAAEVSHHGDAARRFSGHLARDTAENLAQGGVGAGPHDDVIDVVLAGMVEDRLGGIDGFENMVCDLARTQSKSVGPVLETDEALDVLVVAIFVKGLVQGDAIELQHIETSKPGIGRAFKNAFGGAPEIVGELAVHVVEIDGHGDDGRIGGTGLRAGRTVNL